MFLTFNEVLQLLEKQAEEEYLVRQRNLNAWYKRNPWAVAQNNNPRKYPRYLTHREVLERYESDERAEKERREREARQRCNPAWGHTYGCDGCCNFGIDYEENAFAMFP